MPEKTLMNAAALERTLVRMAHEIVERNENRQDILLLGIQRGGVTLAHRLSSLLTTILNSPVPYGTVDVSMHRDDLDNHATPEIHPTTIPGNITGKTVILVDDVLFSGRTVRSALDALNDFGRPRSVQLAVLVDRGHRELPIKADFIGKNVPTSLRERINVRLSEKGGDDYISLETL